MPIYTYRCRECSHQFEQRQRMTDDPLSVCPICEGPVRRVVNSVGVVFKGSGFYVTDNRNDSTPSANGKSKHTGEKSTSKQVSEKSSGNSGSSVKSKTTAETNA